MERIFFSEGEIVFECFSLYRYILYSGYVPMYNTFFCVCGIRPLLGITFVSIKANALIINYLHSKYQYFRS